MSDSWNDFAAGWDDHAGTKAYAAGAFGSLRAVLDGTDLALRGARVLDFGCGTGLLTAHLVDGGAEEIAAVDTSVAMLAMLEAKVAEHGWTGVSPTADLAEVPGDRDLVVCSSVCSFLDDYPVMAARLAGLLRPGGLFIQWDWERTADGDGDDHGLTRAEITDALTGAGLVDIEVGIGFEADAEGETMRPLVGHGRRPVPTGA